MSRIHTGIVVSTKTKNTVIISVERKYRHKMYKKVLTKHQKLHAHYEKDNIVVGDTVEIKETRPISKLKHFIVIGKVGKKSK